MNISIVFSIIISIIIPDIAMLQPDSDNSGNTLTVKKCEDFEVSGLGNNKNWEITPWVVLDVLDDIDKAFVTRFKMLYSETGIYVLAYCEDSLISTEFTEDQGDIWEGDVFEVFFQTDPANPLYFEYEINPLNTELVILVPNNQGDFFGWAPWHYEGNRKVKKAVVVEGGNPQPGAKITAWTAEMFFPFALLKGLKNVPPQQGTAWKANFYRMDYDTGKRIKWSWQPIEINFHEYSKFGLVVFE